MRDCPRSSHQKTKESENLNMKNRLYLIVIFLLLAMFILNACEKKQPRSEANSLASTFAVGDPQASPVATGEEDGPVPAAETESGTVPEEDQDNEETTVEEQAASPYLLEYHPSKDKLNGAIYLERQADGTWKMTGEEYYQGTLRTVLYIALGIFSACVLFFGSYIAYRLIDRRDR